MQLTEKKLAELLSEASQAHHVYEQTLGHIDDSWPTWYAEYINNRWVYDTPTQWNTATPLPYSSGSAGQAELNHIASAYQDLMAGKNPEHWGPFSSWPGDRPLVEVVRRTAELG
jgi:hypothetical protein